MTSFFLKFRFNILIWVIFLHVSSKFLDNHKKHKVNFIYQNIFVNSVSTILSLLNQKKNTSKISISKCFQDSRLYSLPRVLMIAAMSWLQGLKARKVCSISPSSSGGISLWKIRAITSSPSSDTKLIRSSISRSRQIEWNSSMFLT